MLKTVAAILILLFNITVQSAVFPFVEFFGVKPDTLLVLVISFALLSGNPLSGAAGFAGGFIQDVLYGQTLGVFSVQYGLIGLLAGLLHNKVSKRIALIQVFLIAFASIIRGSGILVYFYLTNPDMAWWESFASVVIPETLYTVLTAPIIFYVMSKIYRLEFINKLRNTRVGK